MDVICPLWSGGALNRSSKLLAFVIAGILVSGVVLVGVRSGKETRPQAGPTPTDTALPTTESPSPSPSVTLTFTGPPPFETTSPTASPAPTPSLTGLPTTGRGDGGPFGLALMLLVLSLAGGASLARAR